MLQSPQEYVLAKAFVDSALAGLLHAQEHHAALGLISSEPRKTFNANLEMETAGGEDAAKTVAAGAEAAEEAAAALRAAREEAAAARGEAAEQARQLQLHATAAERLGVEHGTHAALLAERGEALAALEAEVQEARAAGDRRGRALRAARVEAAAARGEASEQARQLATYKEAAVRATSNSLEDEDVAEGRRAVPTALGAGRAEAAQEPAGGAGVGGSTTAALEVLSEQHYEPMAQYVGG